jgi:hypothetical protein
MRATLWTASSLSLLGLISGVASSGASEAIAEQEGMACSVCHVDPETDRLTDQGRYYQSMRSLSGFEAVVQKFGRCAYCHVQEAGSLELTEEGNRFRWMMEDMEGLRAWLDENHPRPAEQDPAEEADQDKPEDGAAGDSPR